MRCYASMTSDAGGAGSLLFSQAILAIEAVRLERE